MNMMKALVVGIDDYDRQPLSGCVNDATEVAALLANNEDGSPNFDVQLLTSENGNVSNKGLYKAISEFFKVAEPLTTAVLYFAGHGMINTETDAGYIAGNDAEPGAPGLPLSDLLALANRAYPMVASTVIILDCCHAGAFGEVDAVGAGSPSVIGKGLTILTAAAATQKAKEVGRHGVFTDLLIDALQGGCADVRGHITPAAVYSHIDQALGAHGQRPLYKANVHRFVTLRQMIPAIPLDVLRRLPVYFHHPDLVFELDPSFEPDRENVPEAIKAIPVNPVNAAVFAELQQYNRQGLVVPVGATHMYYAAIQGKGCKLTPMGKHYRMLAASNKL